MKSFKLILFLLTIIVLTNGVKAQDYTDRPLERRLGFGAEFGVIGAVAGGPYFAMAFSGDYLVGRNFSVAEIISFIPSADLTMVNFNTVARFNIPTRAISLIPYLGVGISYGSYETEGRSENSFSFSFPLGLAVAIPVAAQIEAVGRFQYALTNLDYGVLGDDQNYVEFMLGFRYSP